MCQQVLVGQQGRDAMLYLRKWLKEALRTEGLQPKGRFKPGDCHALVLVCQG